VTSPGRPQRVKRQGGSHLKNAKPEKKATGEAGDIWLWVATDADTKLVPPWFVGGRGSDAAIVLMDDLAARLANRVQMTTDGHRAYLEAVEGAFGSDVDYAQLVKIYGQSPEAEKRYSPAECIGARPFRIEGSLDPAHISTSYAERQNLSMRMHMRRFTRLTNAVSKKFESHVHMVALYTVFYNWTRVHKTLRVTPAMEAGLTDRLWTMEEIADLVEAAAPKPGRPAAYRKRIAT
jgi:IS1 family transposase